MTPWYWLRKRNVMESMICRMIEIERLIEMEVNVEKISSNENINGNIPIENCDGSEITRQSVIFRIFG
jgi:hypothetical protein